MSCSRLPLLIFSRFSLTIPPTNNGTTLHLSSGWLGKNEFNDAVTESADELRYLGKSFTTLHGQSLELIDQSSSIATATDSATCDSGEANTALQSASDGLTLASEDVEGMLKGLGDDLNDMADFIEDNAPYYVNMGIYAVTGLVWVNVLLWLIAACVLCFPPRLLLLLDTDYASDSSVASATGHQGGRSRGGAHRRTK